MKMTDNLRARGSLDEIEEKENDDSAMTPEALRRPRRDDETDDGEVMNSDEEESKVILPAVNRRITIQTIKSQVTTKTDGIEGDFDQVDDVSEGDPFEKDWVDNVEIRLKPDWIDVLH